MHLNVEEGTQAEDQVDRTEESETSKSIWNVYLLNRKPNQWGRKSSIYCIQVERDCICLSLCISLFGDCIQVSQVEWDVLSVVCG